MLKNLLVLIDSWDSGGSGWFQVHSVSLKQPCGFGEASPNDR